MCLAQWTTFPRFITCRDGTRLYVRLYGDRQAPPLILLHREWQMGEMFSCWIEELSSRWRVIIPDQRGHGLSSQPEDPIAYLPQQFAQDLQTLIQVLNLRPAWLYGDGQLGRQVLNAYLARYGQASISGVLVSATSIRLDPDTLEDALCSSGPGTQVSFAALQACLSPEGTPCPAAFWQRFAAAHLMPRAASLGLASLFRAPVTEQDLRSWSPRPLIVSEGVSLARMLPEVTLSANPVLQRQ